MMSNIELLKGLINIIKNQKVITGEDFKVFNGLSTIINERWITIHPHGDVEDENGKKDYRRLKLEDGETPKEAMERAYGKSTDKVAKDTQKIRENIKESFSKREYYQKIDRISSKLWREYAKKLRNVTILWDDTDEVKAEKRSVIDAAHELYKKAADERNQLIKEINQMHRDLKNAELETLNKIGKVDIVKKISKADIKETTKKIEEVIKKFDYENLLKKYDEVHEKFSKEKDKWIDYMNAGKDNEEKLQREKEYDKWFETSEIRKERDKYSTRIMTFDKDRRKAISEALKIKDGADINISVSKTSVLKNKVNEANELLTGIVNKKYIPDFMPKATGRSGRAFASGNLLFLESDDTVTTHIHEAMHWLERVNPEMLANSKAFLEYRTKDEEAQKLKKITGNKGYDSDEITKKDNFFSPYCGKLYDTASEIMSMGVQRLFEHPDDFMKNDREYFDFVIANLQGKL